MRREFLVTPLLILLAVTFKSTYSIPVDPNDSLVVSTTETPKENAPTSDKEDDGPKIPKIYEMRVDSNVTNRFATTRITSKVKNLAKNALETTFSVVLPETAYISGFIMEIDGKSYEAYVKEKEEAKQIYDQAVSSGQAAAHVAVSARDSNRFTVSVNVQPQSKATFKLTYEELLQRRNDQYEVVLNIHPGQPVKDLQVQVNINETCPLAFVKAPPMRSGNEVSKNDEKLDPQADIENIDPKSAVVKFNPNIEKQKQLAHNLGTNEDNGLAGQFLVTYDVERDPHGGEILVKDGYFVHFFAPSELAPLPKQVVFVLDTSGSMDGQRIKQLKEAMNSILGELKKEDVFNIVEFSSTVKVWNVPEVKVTYEEGSDPWGYYGDTTPAPVDKSNQTLPAAFEANEENLQKAREVVEKLNAFGGTDIASALEVGLKLVKKHEDTKEQTHQPMIIFLTDGEPTVGETQPDKIISKIKDLNVGERHSPIFSLSFGNGADRDFLQKISLKNSGFARHIYEAADASLQLQEFYKEISSPLLTDVNFKYVSNITKVTRTIFPIFFHGGELVVAGQAPAGIIDPGFSPCTIWGKGPKGPIELKPVIENGEGALERLWAYLTVKQILEDRDAADNKEPFTKKALDIALKYSFVTPVTSLVVVKPNETSSVNAEDASKNNNPNRFGIPYSKGAYASASASVQGIRTASSNIYRRYNFMPRFGSGGAIPLSGAPIYSTAFHSLPAPPQNAFLGIPSPAISSLAESFEESDRIFAANYPPSTTPRSASKVAATTEAVAETTTVSTVLDNLKKILPWLSSLLDSEGSFSPPSGGKFKLGTDEDLKTVECTKTPINGTVGTCTLLSKCERVHSALKDETVFLEYACYVDNVAGICCPKEEP